jgi:hypothetical protein
LKKGRKLIVEINIGVRCLTQAKGQERSKDSQDDAGVACTGLLVDILSARSHGIMDVLVVTGDSDKVQSTSRTSPTNRSRKDVLKYIRISRHFILVSLDYYEGAHLH